MPENNTPTDSEATASAAIQKTPTIIKQHLVRKLVRLNGKRISQEVLDQMEDSIKRRIEAACNQHNGGKKTIDIAIAGQVHLI